MQVAAKLNGHRSSVSCLAASSHFAHIASGGEDGLLCVHDLETQNPISTVNLHAALSLDPTATAPSLPTRAPSTTATSRSPDPTASQEPEEDDDASAVAAVCFAPASPWLLFAAVGRVACMLDTRIPGTSGPSGAAAGSGTRGNYDGGGASTGQDGGGGAGEAVQGGNASVVQRYEYCKEDVGHLAVNAKGTFLALGDESGTVQVVDLATNKLYKSLRHAHTNICSSVAFRRHRPWEILSGALDHTVARWDFSRGKLLQRWAAGDIPAVTLSPQEREAAGGQMFNPPMVHQVVGADSVTEERPWTRLAAAALGDGSILLVDTEGEAGSSGGAGTGAGKGAGAKGGGKAEKGKAAAGAKAQQAGAGVGSGAQGLVTGARLRLDHELGSHAAPASCVCFIHVGARSRALASSISGRVSGSGEDGGGGAGAGEQSVAAPACRPTAPQLEEELLLASGGDDRCILIWSVSRALTLAARPLQHQQRAAAAGGVGDVGAENSGSAERSSDQPLLYRLQHKRKLNGLCALTPSLAGGSSVLAAADTSKVVTCFRLQQDRLLGH